MMFEGKHIHFSPVNKKPLCSYSAKLCKQKRINGFAFCIRHILEDKSAPFKQCAHVARYNKQKCTNPIPSNENREFCNSHMQVAGMLPKKERKIKKEKEKEILPEGKLKFSERLKILLTKENGESCNDDTFNSDDPYAFPDTVSDNENCVIAYSATPILKNAWNSSQKNISPDMSSLDSPSRGEQNLKVSPTTENKLKSNSPTLSKTMNRLHAKIAQNKLLDKQKKTQDASQCIVTLVNPQLTAIAGLKSNPPSPVDAASINSESSEAEAKVMCPKNNLIVKIEPDDQARSEDSLVSNYTPSPNPPSLVPVDSRLSSGVTSSGSSDRYFCDPEKSSTSDLSSKDKLEFNQVKLPNNESKMDGKIPVALRKLQRLFQKQKKQDKYIFPRGFDSSESSDSEDDLEFYNQLTKFCLWDGHNLNSSYDSLPRSVKQTQLKSELSRSYHQLCRLRTLHKQEMQRQKETFQPLIDAARAYPNHTADILVNQAMTLTPIQSKVFKQPFVAKKTCCYKREEISCKNTVLPNTWHCKKHIMYNVDQLLFEHCTAKFSDNTQCCVPVFDVCHELPLCFEHAKKRDNYNKMASEPKAKKARKKPKPSALTRPPKRGKKKKKPTLVRPSSPSSLPTPLPTPPLPPSSLPPLSPTPVKNETGPEMPNISTTFNNEAIKPVETVAEVPSLKQDINEDLSPELESDLEDFSPGAIEKTLELPLDTAELANQATKLLEEHDFTEVLNKIPDDAFNDLFVDTRNGEYIPSREETEELERALAAVSKDVHLARESLAKLSSSNGPDLEELERVIEIHGGLLGADNLTSAIDENSFVDLSSNHIDNLNVISSSFSTSDLNSLTQALSAISADNLDQNNIPMVSEGSLLPNSINLPLINSELSHPHMLNGQSDMLSGLHHIQLDPNNFSSNIINSANFANGVAPHQGAVDGKLFSNGSLLSTLYYNLASSNTPSSTAQTFSVPPNSGSNTSEEANFMSSSAGINNPNHWLLNSPDVLALSQLTYPNSFLLTSQGGAASYTNTFIGKYPLQDLNTDIALGSTAPSMLPTSNCNTENVICGTNEQPAHNISISSRSASSLQQPRSVKVIVQEGAS